MAHIFWLEEKGIGAEEMRCNGVDGENYENFDNVEGGGAEALVGIDLLLGICLGIGFFRIAFLITGMLLWFSSFEFYCFVI